jgi:hypothetical protein
VCKVRAMCVRADLCWACDVQSRVCTLQHTFCGRMFVKSQSHLTIIVSPYSKLVIQLIFPLPARVKYTQFLLSNHNMRFQIHPFYAFLLFRLVIKSWLGDLVTVSDIAINIMKQHMTNSHFVI